MTRINVIAPSELCDQHLLAEHRELTRIPNCVNSGKYSLDNIPATYVLGTGHVKFFTNKLKWLRSRYNELYEECLKRGFDVTYKFPDSTPENCQGDYIVTAEAIKINLERIALRMPEKARLYGKMKSTAAHAKDVEPASCLVADMTAEDKRTEMFAEIAYNEYLADAHNTGVTKC